MPKKSQIASHYCKNCQSYTFHVVAKKLPPITAKIINFIFSTHCPENHYCKNYQFYIYRSVPRKTLLQKLPISYFPPGAREKIPILYFPPTAQKKLPISYFPPDAQKKFPILYFPPCAQKILKFIPTDCLSDSVRLENEKRRKESKYLRQSRTANNSKNTEFMIKMWSLVFQRDLEMSYHKGAIGKQMRNSEGPSYCRSCPIGTNQPSWQPHTP